MGHNRSSANYHRQANDGDEVMEHAQHARPLFIGVIAGAVSPTLLATLLESSPDRIMVPPLLVVLVALPISLAASTIVGLPLALWLRSKGQLTAIRLCLAGVLVGAVVMAAFNFEMNYWPQMKDQSFAKQIAWNSAISGILPGAVFGAMSSVAFCLGAGIAIRRRNKTPTCI